MGFSKKFIGFILSFIITIPNFINSQENRANVMTITPSEPTHYFYTPKARVNPPWHFVVSLHEVSFSFPANLQLQASLLDNIGRINFGAKYGIIDRLSIGAGLAATLFHIGRGTHGVPTHKGAKPRFGAFVCLGMINRINFENAITFHTQVGDHFSLGADYGMMITPHEWWSAIFELGNSIDFTAHKYSNHNAIWYMNIDTGVRIHPPPFPAFSYDLGVDIEEFALVRNTDISVTVYFDVIFAMVVK